MKRVSVLVVALLLSVQVYAQSNYREGFVITHGSDTLTGIILVRDGGKSYEVCNYKKNTLAEATSYGPKDIAGYGTTGGKRFESKTITLNGGVEETYFLEMVVSGKLRLYHMRDTYWVQKEGGELLLLENHEKESYVDGQRVVRYDNQHIATLSLIMADCPSVMQSIRDLRLDKRPLTKIVTNYNECIGGPSVEFQDHKRWVELGIGVVAGANLSTLKFEGAPSLAKPILGSTKTIAPLFGIRLDLFSPRITERFAFTTGAYYSPVEYTIESKSKPGNDYMKMEIDQVKVPVGVKYMFKGKRVVPYVNAGVSLTFNVKSKVTWFEPASSSTEFLQSEFTVKTTELGFWGGIGVDLPLGSILRGFIECRYEHTNGITPHMQSPFLESAINNVQVLVGIGF